MDGPRLTLGETIAALRRERGLSQGELAEALDVTRSIVSAWENDRRRPRLDKLATLREVIGSPTRRPRRRATASGASAVPSSPPAPR